MLCMMCFYVDLIQLRKRIKQWIGRKRNMPITDPHLIVKCFNHDHFDERRLNYINDNFADYKLIL